MTTAIQHRRIQRVDQPDPHSLCIELSPPKERQYIFIGAGTRRVRAGLSNLRLRGAEATPATTRIRKRLIGARVQGISVTSDRVWLLTDRGSLVVLAAPPSILLLDQDQQVISATGQRRLGTGEDFLDDFPAESTEPLDLDGAAQLERHQSDRDERTRRRIHRQLKRAAAKVSRRIGKIQSEVDRGKKAESLRSDASLLLAGAGKNGDSEGRVTVTNWHTDPPSERVVVLEAGKNAVQTAEAWFKRAGRWERGERIAQKRMDAAKTEQQKLVSLLGLLEQSPGPSLPEALIDWERADADKSKSRGTGAAGAASKQLRKPYREFHSADGGRLWVGRSARDNDLLTLKVARGHDVWLHARGTRGAHVIVPLNKGETCPAERLVDAATLAAHFSEAREESLTEVQYTLKKNVRKPKGLPPGAVRVSQEKTLTLRREPSRLKRLMAASKH